MTAPTETPLRVVLIGAAVIVGFVIAWSLLTSVAARGGETYSGCVVPDAAPAGCEVVR